MLVLADGRFTPYGNIYQDVLVLIENRQGTVRPNVPWTPPAHGILGRGHGIGREILTPMIPGDIGEAASDPIGLRGRSHSACGKQHRVWLSPSPCTLRAGELHYLRFAPPVSPPPDPPVLDCRLPTVGLRPLHPPGRTALAS